MADGLHGEDLERGSEEIPLSSAKFVRADDISFDLRSFFPKIKNVKGRDNADNPIGIIDIAILSSGKIVIVTNECCVRYKLDHECTRIYGCEYYDEEKRAQLVGVVSTVGPKKELLCTYMSERNERFSRVIGLSKERIIAVDTYGTYSKSLTMLSVSDQNISVIRSIQSIECFDISYVDNTLVFGYKEGVGIWNFLRGTDSVKCIQLPGTVITPRVSKVSAILENGRGVIYIYCRPCLGCNIVTKMSLNGDIINTFNNLEFTDAADICATGDGHLFMSFPEENCIRVLLPDMSKAVKVVENVQPIGICYCQETRRLFVVNNEDIDNPCIQVFEIQ